MVRSEEPADHAAISAVNRAAFDRPDEANLVIALREGALLSASSVALVENRVVGHAALSRGTIDNDPILVLAPVAVFPLYQGIGVGTAVVNDVLKAATAEAVTVLGDPAYYSRFGFEDAEPFGVFAPFPVDPGALQILRPNMSSRGTITYGPPFSEL